MIPFLKIKNKIIVHNSILFGLISIVFFQTSCKKLVEVNAPNTSITAKNVYTNNATAIAVITGLYSKISSNGLTGSDLTSIGLITGLSSDELSLYSGSTDSRLRLYYQNNLKGYSGFDFWSTIYNEIYTINLSIDGLNKSTSITTVVKEQLIGEAKFMRAFCYFYLLNLYGDLPLALSTDYTINNVLIRSPQEKVWNQIISDLKDAKSSLSTDYLDGSLQKKTIERVRPTKWAAIALLARVYLYNRDWENAEIESTEIIAHNDLFDIDSLNGVFLKNNKEAIWQLQPVNFGANTEDARIYILQATGPSFFTPVYLSPQLVNSFEIDDQRKTKWIDTISAGGILYYYAYKYKSAILNEPVTEYHTVLRIGEQYLIRAEARAQQGNLDGARNDLNTIRTRAGLKTKATNEKQLLLYAIYHERQVELFTEWGHRWLDLKRTQMVNDVMNQVTPIKGGTWNSNWQLYPILPSDIITNGNLNQNIGY